MSLCRCVDVGGVGGSCHFVLVCGALYLSLFNVSLCCSLGTFLKVFVVSFANIATTKQVTQVTQQTPKKRKFLRFL